MEKRNQVILNDGQHKALKRLASEAGLPMSNVVEIMTELLEERVMHALGLWVNGRAPKDFIVKTSRQSALTIFSALHLLEVGHIDEAEMKALLMGGESGQDLIGLLVDRKTKDERRAFLDRYDVTRNTMD